MCIYCQILEFWPLVVISINSGFPDGLHGPHGPHGQGHISIAGMQRSEQAEYLNRRNVDASRVHQELIIIRTMIYGVTPTLLAQSTGCSI